MTSIVCFIAFIRLKFPDRLPFSASDCAEDSVTKFTFLVWSSDHNHRSGE